MTAAELLSPYRDEFPEHADKSDDYILSRLTKALNIHAICEGASIYLAAHFVTIDSKATLGEYGGGAPVDSGGLREVLSEGGKSINTSYKGISSKDGDSPYTASLYGRTYIQLRNSCGGRRFSVRVG